MEIVLLEDVKALGKKGQIVKVNDGYARNFILPKKLGVEATSKNLNDLKLQKANAEKVAAEQLAAAQELAEKIEKLTVTLKMKAGEGGKAFGSVSSKEIAALLHRQKETGSSGADQDLRKPRGSGKTPQRCDCKINGQSNGGVRFYG